MQLHKACITLALIRNEHGNEHGNGLMTWWCTTGAQSWYSFQTLSTESGTTVQAFVRVGESWLDDAGGDLCQLVP